MRPASRGCRAVRKHSQAPGAVPSGGGLLLVACMALSHHMCSSAHSPQVNLKSPLWSEVHGYNLPAMVLSKPKPCGFLTWRYQVLGPLSNGRKTSPSTWAAAEQARSFRETHSVRQAPRSNRAATTSQQPRTPVQASP